MTAMTATAAPKEKSANAEQSAMALPFWARAATQISHPSPQGWERSCHSRVAARPAHAILFIYIYLSLSLSLIDDVIYVLIMYSTYMNGRQNYLFIFMPCTN